MRMMAGAETATEMAAETASVTVSIRVLPLTIRFLPAPGTGCSATGEVYTWWPQRYL